MARLMRAAAAIAMGVMLSGCAGGPALFGSQTGTVSGHVTMRTCGGAYRVDQNGCQVTTGIVRLVFSGGSTARFVNTGNDGGYRIDLAPGTYGVKVEMVGSSLSNGPGPQPRFAGPAQVVVSAGRTVTADFTATIELL
jgi:Carboxypeptidase regulatory-like domain